MKIIFFLLTASFFHNGLADSALSKKAEKVLNSIEYELPASSIIGKREWKELELDRLVTILDRSKTSFGRWGLVQLLHPIADEKELLRRKKIITFLVDHEDEMLLFQEQLERVHRVEKSLLAYWDTYDQLNQNAHQFYYTNIGLRKLNKSSLALNISTAMELFNSWKYLMTMLAFGGISAEYTGWLYEGKKFDVIRGLKSGLAEPMKQHSLERFILEDPAIATYTYKDYIKALIAGSWMDRYLVTRYGYAIDKENLGVLSWFTPHDTSMNPVGAFISATIPTLLFDYQWGSAILSTGKRIVSMYQTLNELQQRVSDVAQCVDAIQKLDALVAKRSPVLRSYLEEEEVEDDSKEMIDALLTQRFLKKSNHLYSRGHVLTMHLDLVKKKKELIPLLHSIAFLDAYCSIAELYKESQNEAVVFSFPEFIESEIPFINYQTTWLPLLSPAKAINNDIIFGKTKPGKIIITGPNGGGKSTFLKTLGIGSILSQSWGIVPAAQAQQTLFSVIRTGIAPREDLEQGLSTFMAEKKTMAELLEDIHRANIHQKTLVLIDEPYKGTVDAESAKRIYEFGKDIAHYPQALVVIATHVKKPIALAHDTGGIFGNYQVKIRETSLGAFERLFKLEEGPAMWWFEDSEKRSRFVDWISVKDNLNA